MDEQLQQILLSTGIGFIMGIITVPLSQTLRVRQNPQDVESARSKGTCAATSSGLLTIIVLLTLYFLQSGADGLVMMIATVVGIVLGIIVTTTALRQSQATHDTDSSR